MSKLQDRLLLSLIDALPEGKIVPVDERVKKRLDNAARTHYKAFPEALKMQVGSTIVPSTVENYTRAE